MSRSPLTSQQLAEFDQMGVVRLPGFLPTENVAAMADAIWADLNRRFGVERDRPDTWRLEPRSPRDWQALIRSGAFSPLGTPELLELGDGVAQRHLRLGLLLEDARLEHRAQRQQLAPGGRAR